MFKAKYLNVIRLRAWSRKRGEFAFPLLGTLFWNVAKNTTLCSSYVAGIWTRSEVRFANIGVQNNVFFSKWSITRIILRDALSYNIISSNNYLEYIQSCIALFVWDCKFYLSVFFWTLILIINRQVVKDAQLSPDLLFKTAGLGCNHLLTNTLHYFFIA